MGHGAQNNPCATVHLGWVALTHGGRFNGSISLIDQLLDPNLVNVLFVYAAHLYIVLEKKIVIYLISFPFQ